MKTTAQNISALLNDDGQRWYDAAGIHLDMLAETAGGWATRSPRATGTYRWDFRDGSAIVCAGAGWDFPLAPDPDCFCWEGEGEHQPGCSHTSSRAATTATPGCSSDEHEKEMTTMTTATTQPIDETYKATRAGIEELKARADEILQQELHGIAQAAGRDDTQAVSLRLKRRNVLEELVSSAAWLAGDLVGVLLNVAAEEEPFPVMASDLSRRIREAEIRLELLREMTRKGAGHVHAQTESGPRKGIGVEV